MKKLLVPLALMLGGCASHPGDIEAAYISSLQFKDYDCEQLAGEAERINTRVFKLHDDLEETANGDAAQVGLAFVFWPTLLFLEGGDGPAAHEYARLRGERNAIKEVSTHKKCGIEFKEIQVEKYQNPDDFES